MSASKKNRAPKEQTVLEFSDNKLLVKLAGVGGIGVARFGEKDVVCHALVTRVVTAYNAHDAARAAGAAHAAR